MQTTIQQVRQILVNELGLTREVVREEARAFIMPVVEAEVRRLVDQGGIREMVHEQLDRWSRERDTTRGVSIADVVRHEAAKVAKEWFRDNVEIKSKST